MSDCSARLIGRPFPVILAAPSGAGKTTVARLLRERRDDVVFSVSATTRAPRSYEKDGRDYHFVSEAEFREMVGQQELVEWAEVHGNFYGTPLKNFREAEAAGAHLLLDIDVEGARQIRSRMDDVVSIFILPPSGWELAERLIGRASEPEAVRLRRLGNACAEVAVAATFDYVLVNDDLEATVHAVEQIFAAESYRPRRIPELAQVVGQLGDDIRRYVEMHQHSHSTEGENSR